MHPLYGSQEARRDPIEIDKSFVNMSADNFVNFLGGPALLPKNAAPLSLDRLMKLYASVTDGETVERVTSDVQQRVAWMAVKSAEANSLYQYIVMAVENGIELGAHYHDLTKMPMNEETLKPVIGILAANARDDDDTYRRNIIILYRNAPNIFSPHAITEVASGGSARARRGIDIIRGILFNEEHVQLGGRRRGWFM